MKEGFLKEESKFTQVRNEVLEALDLSWKAKGLYAYLYSKPGTWQFAVNRIAKDGSGGRRQILSGLRELERVGLLTREKQVDGRMLYKIWIHRQIVAKTTAKSPECGKRTLLKPHRAKTAPINNMDIVSNKEKVVTRILAADAAEIEKVLLLFKETGLNSTISRTNKTQRNALTRLLGQFGLQEVVKQIDRAAMIKDNPYFGSKVRDFLSLERNWSWLQDFKPALARQDVIHIK